MARRIRYSGLQDDRPKAAVRGQGCQMRGLRLALSICAGLAAGPALAGYYGPPASGSPLYSTRSMVTGDVALALGWYDPNPGKSTGQGLADFRLNLPINELWNTELELGGLASFRKHGFDAFSGFGHFYYKTPQVAFGGLVGGESVTNGSGFTAGGEAALFMATTTLLGHASYTWADGYPDFWTLAGEFRWYLNPNTKFDGIVTYYNGGGDAWAFTGGVEHLIARTNLSLFGNATYYNYNHGDDAWQLMAGGRYSFGRSRGTLQQFDWDQPFSAAPLVRF